MPTTATNRPPIYSTKTSPFLDQVRQILRPKQTSRRTEESYLHDIVDFIRFHDKRSPMVYT